MDQSQPQNLDGELEANRVDDFKERLCLYCVKYPISLEGGGMGESITKYRFIMWIVIYHYMLRTNLVIFRLLNSALYWAGVPTPLTVVDKQNTRPIIIISDATAICGPWPSSEAPAIPVCSQCPYVLSDTVFPSQLRSSTFLVPSGIVLNVWSLATPGQYNAEFIHLKMTKLGQNM